MNTAEKLLASSFTLFRARLVNGGLEAIDNDETIEFFNENCVSVTELCGQETWVQFDGSYVTRNDDLYFSGDDITDFEIIHEDLFAQRDSGVA